MKTGLAIGLVVGHGGVSGLGDGELGPGGDSSGGGGAGIIDAISDGAGDIADGIGDIFDRSALDGAIRSLAIALVGVCTLFWSRIASAAQQATEKASGWMFALYIGPTFEFGPFFFTFGACLGQFGCLSVGGGISIGPIGLGVLIPIWVWW